MWKPPFLQLVAPQYVPAVATSIYDSPFTAGFANGQTWIGTIWFYNTTSSDRTVRLHLVPAGGSPLQSNALLFDHIVPANINTIPCPYFLQTADGELPLFVVAAGESLYVKCDAADSVTVTIGGAELQG